MRARMSDAPRRLDPDIFGCGSREMSERVAGIYALSELIDILADVEPRQEQGMSGHWPCGRPNMAWQADRFCCDESGYLSGTGWMAHAALVESLRSFVEGC